MCTAVFRRSNCLRARKRRWSRSAGCAEMRACKMRGAEASACWPRCSEAWEPHARPAADNGASLAPPQTLLCRDWIVISREEADAHGQGAIALKRETGGTQQKVAGYLGHDADAVAALAIGGHGAAMRKTSQRGQSVAAPRATAHSRHVQQSQHRTNRGGNAGQEGCRWKRWPYRRGLWQGTARARVGALGQCVGTRGRRSGSRRVPVVRHSSL